MHGHDNQYNVAWTIKRTRNVQKIIKQSSTKQLFMQIVTVNKLIKPFVGFLTPFIGQKRNIKMKFQLALYWLGVLHFA